jgi:hypothetical protein
LLAAGHHTIVSDSLPPACRNTILHHNHCVQAARTTGPSLVLQGKVVLLVL